MKTKKKPYFSIITVTKNSEKTIERNIKSLKAQTIKDFEHIVIDGNSNDGTIDIIKKHSKNISYFDSKKDKNMWNAINKGIKVAKGEVIGILNSDDILYPNGLKIVKKYFNKKKLDYLFATVKKKKIYHGFYPEKIYYKFNIFPSHSVGFYIKKKVHNKIGLYDDKFRYCADYDLIFRLIKNNFKGSHTSKSEIVGKFYSGGISEKISFLKYIYFQSKVRIKQKQNIFYIIILGFVHLFYHFLRRIFNAKNY